MAGEASNHGDGPNIDPSIANPTYIGTERAQRRMVAHGNDGSGGGFDSLALRVSHMEARIERVETKLDMIVERLGAIATRSETRNYVWLAIATFVAIIGLLIAAMGWLETRASRLDTGSPAPQPIIIQLPDAAKREAPVTRPAPPRPAVPHSPG